MSMSETRQAFAAPTYTQTPNELFDVFMRQMTDAELRVVLVAVRRIIGWHKDKPEAISISQFEEMTGMSRQGVLNGIQAALKSGLLIDAGTGARGVSLYTLNVNEVDTTTSQRSRPELVNAVDQSTATTSQRSRHTKERVKKEKKATAQTTRLVASRTSEQVAQDAIAQAWQDVVSMGTAPTYLRKEAAMLIEMGATPELVAEMAREKQEGRADTYKLAWLVEDWTEWNGERQRRAKEKVAVAAARKQYETERMAIKSLLGGGQ